MNVSTIQQTIDIAFHKYMFTTRLLQRVFGRGHGQTAMPAAPERRLASLDDQTFRDALNHQLPRNSMLRTICDWAGWP